MSTLREVFERQWVLHERNAAEKRKFEQEIKEMEAKITQRSRGLSRKELSQLCAICLKVKVATTAALVCGVCRKKTCTRCGNRYQSTWTCALCMKKREMFKFSGGAWHNDVERHERFQVQEMLNRLAEESVRRMEMANYNTQEETVRISTPAENPPRLNHPPTIETKPQVTIANKFFLKTGSDDGDQVHDDVMDEYDDDDDVFEDQDDGSESDNYLNFPHEEEQRRLDGSCDSYSSVHYSSLDEEGAFYVVAQCASGGTPEDLSPVEDTKLEGQSPKRKVAVSILSKQRNCPLIHKVTLQKDLKMSEEFGSGAEFGIRVVGGRMCTGGFIGVYVAKVMRGLSAVQCIKEGDQILEWNHTSMVDVTFEKVRSIVAESPQEITLVLCHNAASFTDSRTPSKERISGAREEKQKRKRHESVKCWSRWSLTQLTENDGGLDKYETQRTQFPADEKIGQIQLHLWHDPHGNNMVVRVLSARGLSLQDMPNQELPNLYVLLYLLPNREISSHFRTNTDPETVTPKWDLSFIFSNIPESELTSRTLEVTLWSEDQKKRNVFLGEVLIKLTPEPLCSGAQWYDLVDHDESSSFLPVPMPRRHSLSNLDPINKGNSCPWDANAKVKKYSLPVCKPVSRSISTVNISRGITPSIVINNGNGDSALHQRKRRRADSVVTMEAFRPRAKTELQKRGESFRRKFLESCKCSSAPATPTASIPASLEDLRRKRAFTRSTDIVKSPIKLSQYLLSFKSAQDSTSEQEQPATKMEREGKKKGALDAMKKYPSNLRIRLSRLTIKQSPLEECSTPGPRGPTTRRNEPPGCQSAPATPNVTKSSEDIRRERSFTNYLLVPPSPGGLTGHLKLKRLTTPPVAESEELGSCFSFPKPALQTQLSNVDEKEATKGQNEENKCQATLPESSPLENVTQASCSNVNDEWQIPLITIQPSTSGEVSPFGESCTEHKTEPEPEVEAEQPAEKKGTMYALRRYSRSLMPRSSSLKSSDKMSMFGEDPVKGVVGPGQMRRGSYQGHELGYIRIGLLGIRGILEVEIIRGVGLMVPGDHPPDTYVKTYLIQDQIRLLKRKTSITRQSVNPVYNCKIKYPGRDLHNKELVVSIWCKQGIFGRKVLLGEVRIALGSLNLSVKQVSWYKLFIESQLSDD
ncbi:regulating synaptic membrane exocytosis protein 2-like isoform X1 [Oculina patagonica]